jgi:condensin complex subunit 1
MEARVDFDINDALKHYSIDPASVPTPEAPAELVDCKHDSESLTPALINSVLNPVVDAVAESPDAITRSSIFDTLQFLLKCVPVSSTQPLYSTTPDCRLFLLSRSSAQIPLSSLSKILDLLTSALSAEADLAHADLEANEEETMPHHKQLLDMYAFLMQWTISAVETRALEKPATATTKGRGKGAKSKAGSKDDNWDSSDQLERALDVISKVLKLKLARIFVTTSERDTFIGLFTKPVYHVLENEARVKKTSIKMHCFRVLCIAVKHHGHAFGRLYAGKV